MHIGGLMTIERLTQLFEKIRLQEPVSEGEWCALRNYIVEIVRIRIFDFSKEADVTQNVIHSLLRSLPEKQNPIDSPSGYLSIIVSNEIDHYDQSFQNEDYLVFRKKVKISLKYLENLGRLFSKQVLDSIRYASTLLGLDKPEEPDVNVLLAWQGSNTKTGSDLKIWTSERLELLKTGIEHTFSKLTGWTETNNLVRLLSPYWGIQVFYTEKNDNPVENNQDSEQVEKLPGNFFWPQEAELIYQEEFLKIKRRLEAQITSKPSKSALFSAAWYLVFKSEVKPTNEEIKTSLQLQATSSADFLVKNTLRIFDSGKDDQPSYPAVWLSGLMAALSDEDLQDPEEEIKARFVADLRAFTEILYKKYGEHEYPIG